MNLTSNYIDSSYNFYYEPYNLNLEKDLKDETAFSETDVEDPLIDNSLPTRKKYAAIRKNLAKKLEDIERTDAIIEIYAKNIEPLLSKKESKIFLKWLERKAFFLGSAAYDHDLFYTEMPGENIFETDEFKKAFNNFVTLLVDLTSKHHIPYRGSQNRRIAIFYPGTGGGGHQAPARAIGQYLQETGCEVEIIDVDAIEKLYDPLVEGYSRGEIYSEIFQKEGNKKKATQLWSRADSLHSVNKRNYIADLRGRMQKFMPDKIISVAHHKPKYSNIAFQLNIPMIYISTDHVFNRNLYPLIKEQSHLPKEKHLLLFTALSNAKNFFSPILKELRDKNFLPKEIRTQIAHLDFPIRQSFQPVSSIEKQKLREEKGISTDAIICKLAMGQNGLKHEIEKVIHIFLKEKEQFQNNVILYVVCGKNEQLRTDLEQKLQQDALEGSQLKICICGFMDEKEMSELDKMSDIWFTKPGGATTSELIQMQKQMLYVCNAMHPWEKTNALVVEKFGLAKEFVESRSLTEQIIEQMQQAKALDLLKIPPNNWKAQITAICQDLPKEDLFCNLVKAALNTDLSEHEIWELSNFIHNKLLEEIKKGSYYFSRAATGLACPVEWDPEKELVFIHLKDYCIKPIGHGHAKQVTYSLMYTFNNLEPIACLHLKKEGLKDEVIEKHSQELARECDILKRISEAGCCYLARPIAITQHADKKKSQKQLVLQQIYSNYSLRSFLKKHTLTIEEKTMAATSMLKGLCELHGLGYVHRDTHLGNFLVDKSKKVVLTDFGHSIKKEDAVQSYAQAAKYHRSPEGLFHEMLGADDYQKTDLFALGTCFYEMVYKNAPKWMSNKKIFEIEDITNLEEKHEHSDKFKSEIAQETEPRRSALLEKQNTVPLSLMEKLEFVTLNLVHGNPTVRKSTADWINFLEADRPLTI